MSQPESVVSAREGKLLIITINRPQARNAVDLSVAEGLEAAVAELDADSDLAVGIVTGAGGTFCAGMDLKAFARGERPYTENGGFAGIVERPPRKILIAAIEGYALAGGLEIALSCDLLVAARDAKLGIPEVGVGLIAAGGALLRLPSRIPYHLAMEMAVTGEPITAEQAHTRGLLNHLSDPGQALPAARELGERIAANAPLALAASKQTLVSVRDWTSSEEWQRQAELADPIFGSEDALEGARAFAEKRSPHWQGC
ncbi:MAG TPA: crotonase/enoyl-CoA hydratase family protein [Solirubrobacterales bacterium]|nr:crotonase/enoyl-CoA hydratase family protein [Solirubrobacterales bacterium]